MYGKVLKKRKLRLIKNWDKRNRKLIRKLRLKLLKRRLKILILIKLWNNLKEKRKEDNMIKN